MTGEFIVAKLKNLEPIEGAERIQQAKIFGERVIIPKQHKEGEIGLLFDCETQLSHDYVYHNNLYRKENMNFNKEKSGYVEEKRRVKPIKLRGVKCSGLWMPIESLHKIPQLKDFDLELLNEGEQHNVVGGIEICKKYVSPQTKRFFGKHSGGRIKANLTPTFKEHVDTDQLMRNTHDLTENSFVILTEKLHGTSGRVGYLPIIKKSNIWERIFGFFMSGKYTPVKTEYGFVVGSRRVVKSIDGNEQKGKDHFYATDLWTTIGKETFENKLYKGETVYFEIVGFTPEGTSIMPSVNNDKLKNFLEKDEFKKFKSRYGDYTNFNYGCSPHEKLNDVYVYRITITNDDGVSYDLSWDQVKLRAEEMGVKHVPELERRILTNNDITNDMYVNYIEELAENPSNEFPNSIREGIVIRIETGKRIPIFLKHKSFVFKVLEGIIKESDVVDMEESN